MAVVVLVCICKRHHKAIISRLVRNTHEVIKVTLKFLNLQVEDWEKCDIIATGKKVIKYGLFWLENKTKIIKIT